MEKDLMKLIQTPEQYEQVINRISELMVIDTDSDQELSDELDVLSVLAEKYEIEHFPLPLPDPISAILFRMDQQGLKQSDLITYMGSKSKVSEVLNRKRPLTLSMIRGLHKGLAIPAEVLLQEQNPNYLSELPDVKWESFPISEMINRGFLRISEKLNDVKGQAEEFMRDFFEGKNPLELSIDFHRQKPAAEQKCNPYARIVWHMQVLKLARIRINHFDAHALNDEFFLKLVNLSDYPNGIKLVPDYLNSYGIHFVPLLHMKQMHLDGALLQAEDGNPLIALAFRFDRVDWFWFTLMHELGHLKLHYNSDKQFFDSFEVDCAEQIENEANHFAEDTLIPPQEWEKIKSVIDPKKVIEIARTQHIAPEIIFGRIRKERNDFKLFSQFVNKPILHNFDQTIKG